MANKIILKKSSVAAKVPLSTDLEVGELAVNLADAKLYSKDSSGTVIEVGGGGGAGDVVGPASATDNALARYDGTTGKLIQNGNITQDDNGNLANVNSVAFDTTPSTPPTAAGSLSWNSSEGSLDLVMSGGNVSQHIGEEMFYRVRNATGSTINKGVPVYASGVTAGSKRIEVTPLIANGSIDEIRYIGVTSESISNGVNGLVTEFGYIRNIDTTGTSVSETWTEGDILYVSQTTAGAFTNVEPTAPDLKIVAALVIYVDNNFGVLFVRPTAYPHLTHLSDVNINTPASGNTLIYDAVQGRWENANLTDGTGITITEGAGSITIANAGVTSATAGTGITVSGSTGSVTITNSDRGSSQNIFKNVAVSGQSTIVADSNNDTLTVAAGTGVSLATNATTDTLTITNTAPDQTVSIASGSGISATGTYPSFTVANTGVLSLTGTANEIEVSASTGAVTISLPATINASTTGSAATLTTARTIRTNLASTSTASFNGSANITPGVTGTLPIANGGTGATTAGAALTSLGAYPATNPNGYTSNTGTVTSVGLSAPTGLTVSGSPVTSSGTLALTYTAGYSIPTTASQTNWNTAYTDRLKWDGGATGLTASTGRTSLGATTVGSNFFTLTNPGAIRFPRMNADNTVSSLTAADFRTAIGAGTGSGTVTSVAASAGTGISVSGSPITTSGTLTITNTGVTSAVAGTGISVSGATGAVTVTNSDRGSSQAIFKNVAVSGQSTIVADTNNDTLTIAAGSNITLTTDAGTDTLTIAASGGSTPTTDTYDTGTAATWTKPASANWVLIEIWGGGGSGGRGTTGGNAPAGGGGGGAYNSLLVKFADLQGTVTYTVGAGGAGVTTSATVGNAGGTTSVTMNSYAGGGNKTFYAYGGGGGGRASAGGRGGGGGGISGTGQNGGTIGFNTVQTGTLTSPGSSFGGLPTTATSASGLPSYIFMNPYGGGMGGCTYYLDTTGTSTVIEGNSIYMQSVYGGGGGGHAKDGNGNTTTDAGSSIYGGGGGGGAANAVTAGAGGMSVYGGSGSDGTIDTTPSSDGNTPGGGSGGTEDASSGAGGSGRVRFTYW